MSDIEDRQSKIAGLAGEASDLTRTLHDRKSTLETEKAEIKKILGGSNADVDKAMISAIDDAVTNVGDAIKRLGAFAAAARARGGRI